MSKYDFISIKLLISLCAILTICFINDRFEKLHTQPTKVYYEYNIYNGDTIPVDTINNYNNITIN